MAVILVLYNRTTGILSSPGSVIGYLLGKGSGNEGILNTVTTQIAVIQNGAFIWNVDGYSRVTRTATGGILMTSATGSSWSRDDTSTTTSLSGKKYLFYVQTPSKAVTLTLS